MLLDRDGVLYREPLIEPQPPYAGSGHDVRSAVSSVLSGAPGWTAGADSQTWLTSQRLGLFLPRGGIPIELYAHQVEMLRSSTRRGDDAVILTGTGSGKTEAIYLPVLAALARESAGWPALPPPPAERLVGDGSAGGFCEIGAITRGSRSARTNREAACPRFAPLSSIR